MKLRIELYNILVYSIPRAGSRKPTIPQRSRVESTPRQLTLRVESKSNKFITIDNAAIVVKKTLNFDLFVELEIDSNVHYPGYTIERVLPLEFTDIFHAYSHHTVCTLLSVSICFVKILSRSFIVCI